MSVYDRRFGTSSSWGCSGLRRSRCTCSRASLVRWLVKSKTSVCSSSSASQTRGRVRSRRSFVSYSPPSSAPSMLRISVPRRVTGTLPSPTNIWFRGGTNASPFSTRPPEPGVRSGTPKLSRCFRMVERASQVVSTTTVKPSASSTNRLGSAT